MAENRRFEAGSRLPGGRHRRRPGRVAVCLLSAGPGRPGRADGGSRHLRTAPLHRCRAGGLQHVAGGSFPSRWCSCWPLKGSTSPNRWFSGGSTPTSCTWTWDGSGSTRRARRSGSPPSTGGADRGPPPATAGGASTAICWSWRGRRGPARWPSGPRTSPGRGAAEHRQQGGTAGPFDLVAVASGINSPF